MGILATSDATLPILSTIIILPFLGALIVVALPRRLPELVRPIGVFFSAATGALTVLLATQFDKSDSGFQFETVQSWIPDLGISWHVGVDGISLWLVVLTGLLFPVVLAGLDPHGDVKPYTAWMLVLQAGSLGAFLALDVFMFFVFFEIVLVPMYMLISGWGYSDRRYAATKFFLYTMFGSALMLVAIVTLVSLSSVDGAVTFDLVQLAERQALATNTARWLFLAFAFAFAIKVPMVPFHTWLPDAHTQAPTGGSVILAAVMLKLGTYGFLRFGLYLFPEATVHFAPMMVSFGVVGIIYGAVVATVQRDLKRLVAYSSVAHMGFIVLGTFALTTQGVSGGVLQMVNHGISTGALFILVGMIYERRKTREISELSGLQQVAPVLAGVFTVAMLSSVGLPGLNGFTGEFLILLGSFETRRWWTVVAAAGVILAAIYLLWAYQRVFHGEPEPADLDTPEIRKSELGLLAPFLAAMVFLGVYPALLLDRIEPSVDRLISHVEAHSDYERPDDTPAVFTITGSDGAGDTHEGGDG